MLDAKEGVTPALSLTAALTEEYMLSKTRIKFLLQPY
jgi:hypothetical protein